MNYLRRRRDARLREQASTIAHEIAADLRDTFVERREHDRAIEEIDRRLARVSAIWEALSPGEEET